MNPLVKWSFPHSYCTQLVLLVRKVEKFTRYLPKLYGYLMTNYLMTNQAFSTRKTGHHGNTEKKNWKVALNG